MLRSCLRAPLFWILVVAAGLRLAGLFWGLPASDGWDDDGFAPRNFLTALALTYKHGAYFTYPPLHAFLLALLTLPGIILALLHTPSFHQADVIGEFTKPGFMTFFAVVGRLVSLVMSLGIIWCLHEMTRLVAAVPLGEVHSGSVWTTAQSKSRAGLFAAGAGALGFGLTYYGQVSNLDVPYLFWSLLALLWGMRAIVERAPRHFWGAALLAAAAVATKDQAYALFALSLPAFLLLWFALDRWPRENIGKIGLTLFSAAAVALFLLLLVDGAITNPTGFARRMAFLAGPASQDYGEYLSGPAGWRALLADMGRTFAQGHGVVLMTLAILGLILHGARSRGSALVAGLLPALAILSFTLCFNFAALRSDDRFLLPQAVLACFYIGIAAEALAFSARPRMRLVARAALAVTALFALHQSIAVNAAFLLDPRYDAQSWMATHVRPGDSIETYGPNCFLPHFPPGAAVVRVGSGDLKLRNPLPGVTEVRTSFSAPRGSRFIVVSTAFARRYLRPGVILTGGHVYSPLQQADFRNSDGQLYFRRLVSDQLGYRLVHASHYDGLWPAVHIHDSLNEAIWIFERAR